MLKLKHAAIATTTLVIVAGFAMVVPFFFQPAKTVERQKVMLSITISESIDLVDWSQGLSSLLNRNNVPASVFIVGKVAERYPEVVSHFGKQVDIGSMTYSNLDLTNIPDYLVKLQEVKEGKIAVDSAGSIYTRIFQAPFGATDQDIYSLLGRSDILADFSYESQYNVFQNGQFIKYDAVTYNARDYTPGFFSTLPQSTKPIIIVFDNSFPLSAVKELISALKKADVDLVNASGLTGFNLTLRGDELVNRQAASY